MNAGIEFSQHILSVKKLVACAIVKVNNMVFTLNYNFTEQELRSFVAALCEQTYDAGYGGQELFGNIWFTDNSWSERYEYDGSECWDHKSRPEVPEELHPTYEGSKGDSLIRWPRKRG